MLFKANQNLAAWLAEFGIGKFYQCLGAHHFHRLTQQSLLLLKLG